MGVSVALLKEFIKLAVESPLARVPNQLLSPDSDNHAEEESPSGEEAVQEFSGVGSIMGYSLPLGMDPDAAGRQKNAPRRKKKK
jgi:hypothetical protein